MDKEIKDIMKKLGDAINESMQDSEKIQQLLREVEAKGFTLTLSLAVIVGLKNQNQPRKRLRRENVREEVPGFSPTPFDRKFLKALRIRLSEEAK